MRKLIRNGLIYDGSGGKPQQLELLIEGDKIAEIGVRIERPVDMIIDAGERVITPGFIDIHRHCDVDALYNRDFGQIELAQGLTTVIGGNCGLAPIPNRNEFRHEIFEYIEPCLGKVPNEMNFGQMEEYLRALEGRKLPIHVGSFVGAGTAKAAVKGYRKSACTAKELAQIVDYIKAGLAAGAAGLSMGLMYQPECYSSRKELVSMASALQSTGKVLTCHIRGEGDRLLASIKEAIEIAQTAEVPLHITHFKSIGIRNWNNNIYKAIEIIEKAQGSGQEITVDFYPYTGGATTILSLVPPQLMDERLEDFLVKLLLTKERERFKQEMYKDNSDWDNIIDLIGWERITISSVTKAQNKKYVGKSLLEASRYASYQDPCDFIWDLIMDERGKVGVISHSMSQKDVEAIATLPYSMVISDALYGNCDSPHPRLYGSFPKFICEYVEERKILSLETAIKKMTAQPAQLLRLKNRGVIQKGYYADLNIFHPEKLRDHGSYEDPKHLSTGMYMTLVDGEIVSQENKIQETKGAGVIGINSNPNYELSHGAIK